MTRTHQHPVSGKKGNRHPLRQQIKQKRQAGKGKNNLQNLIGRMRLRATGIDKTISDLLRILGIHATNPNVERALMGKLQEWAVIHQEFESDLAEIDMSQAIEKAKNDAKLWSFGSPWMSKLVRNIFTFFRQLCNVYEEEHRAGIASLCIAHLALAIYDSGSQGNKPVFNQTQAKGIECLTLPYVRKNFPELEDYYQIVIESFDGDHDGDAREPKKQFNHFVRVMRNLSTLTNLAPSRPVKKTPRLRPQPQPQQAQPSSSLLFRPSPSPRVAHRSQTNVPYIQQQTSGLAPGMMSYPIREPMRQPTRQQMGQPMGPADFMGHQMGNSMGQMNGFSSNYAMEQMSAMSLPKPAPMPMPMPTPMSAPMPTLMNSLSCPQQSQEAYLRYQRMQEEQRQFRQFQQFQQFKQQQQLLQQFQPQPTVPAMDFEMTSQPVSLPQQPFCDPFARDCSAESADWMDGPDTEMKSPPSIGIEDGQRLSELNYFAAAQNNPLNRSSLDIAASFLR